MPTSTAMTASSGTWRVMRGEHRGRADARPAVVGQAALPSRPARSPSARRRRPAGRPGASDARTASASSRGGARRRRPSTGTVTGWKRPSAIGSKSTWMIGLYVGDAGVVGERRAEHHEQVGLVHQPAGDRGAAAAEHAAAERVVVGDLALGLERGEHRRAEGARPEPTTVVHVEAGAVADDDHRPPGAGEQRRAPRRAAAAGGAIARSATRPVGPTGRRRPEPAGTCTSSGSTRWATSRSTMACLHGQRRQLGVVGVGQHRAST